ncbi:hypothetical protein KQE47_17500, partial [Raoultella planticola]|nr:hypothetical protein [Raoultella planticola]MDC3910168.1 hypothetical protein [Raoultella planticola]
KSAQIREILISESAWEEMTCLFAPSLEQERIVSRVNELFSICDILKSRLLCVQQTQLHLADALTDAALN